MNINTSSNRHDKQDDYSRTNSFEDLIRVESYF